MDLDDLGTVLSRKQDVQVWHHGTRSGLLGSLGAESSQDIINKAISAATLVPEASENLSFKESVDLDDSNLDETVTSQPRPGDALVDLSEGLADDLTGSDSFLDFNFNAHGKVREYHKQSYSMLLSMFVKNDVVTFADLELITTFLRRERLHQKKEYNAFNTFFNDGRSIEKQSAVPYARRACKITNSRYDIFRLHNKTNYIQYV